jgi:hypothetical protein
MEALCNLVFLLESTFLMQHPIQNTMETLPATVVSRDLRDKLFRLVQVQMEAAVGAEADPQAAALARDPQQVAPIQEPLEVARDQDQEAAWEVELAVVWEPEVVLVPAVRSGLAVQVATEALEEAEALVDQEGVVDLVATAAVLVTVNNLRVAMFLNTT